MDATRGGKGGRRAAAVVVLALVAWLLATGAPASASEAGVTMTPPAQAAQAAQADASDDGAQAGPGEPAEGGEEPEPAGPETAVEDASTGDRESRAGPGQGSQDEDAEEDPEQAPQAQDSPALALEATASGMSVTVRVPGGTARVRLELAGGVKPSPGVYASGDELAFAGAEAAGDGAVVTLDVDCAAGEASADVRLSGASPDGALVTRATLTGADGERLAEVGPVQAQGGTDAVAYAQSASEPFVTDGYFSNTSSPTEHSIPTLRNARTGGVAYCNDMFLNAPGDPQHGSSDAVWYRSWQFSPDPATAAEEGQNYLDFVLFWGYPTDPTVGGRCSEADGRAATQWALWNFTNPGSHPTWEAPSQSWSAGFWHAYDWLVAAAVDYNERCLAQGAAAQPEHGTCEVWEVDDGDLQSILTANPRWGWLRLEKASSRPDLVGTAGYALAGAAFEVRAADGSVVATLVTDAAGRAEVLVPTGSYTLVETRPPAGHDACGPLAASVAGGPVRVCVSATDTAVLGSLSVEKHGGADDGPALAGATFAVMSADGAVVATLVTGKDGRASTADASLPLGTYTLRETKAPDGCAKAPDVTFEVTAAKRHVEVSVTDPYDTTIEVVKLDAKTKSPLAGAHLQVLDASGAQVEAWVSDTSPHVMRGLAPGAYVLRELEAPAGYEKAPDVAFEVRLASATQAVTMADARRKVPFAFTKTSATTGAALPGAQFSLHRPTREVPAKVGQDEIADETLWAEVGRADSDEAGRVDFGELEEGTYLLLEDEAPDGYQRPTGGWLVTCSSVDGVSARSVGAVPPAPLSPTTEGLTLANAPAGELPHAGGRGPGPLPGAGVALVGAGAAIGARAARRAARAGLR